MTPPVTTSIERAADRRNVEYVNGPPADASGRRIALFETAR
jgi:hypothetical protein